jgi:DNA replication protein DnaC
MSEVKSSLKTVLKRLKLSGLLPGLLDRAAYAQKTTLAPLDFLELALQDEIDRREQKNLSTRLTRAGFSESQTFEEFDWNVPVTFDRDRVRDLFNLQFLDRREDIIFLGPVGVGKTSLACALGHSACRAGHRVLFLRSDDLLKHIHQSRADNSTERLLRGLLVPDLLIVDDFGLRRLNAQQSSDFYEVIIERHRRASTIVTSNRPECAGSARPQRPPNRDGRPQLSHPPAVRPEGRTKGRPATQTPTDIAKYTPRPNTQRRPQRGWIKLVRMSGSSW